VLGRSFDPEGIVFDPRTGRFIAADEYGPSVYVFDRRGGLRKVFETPANLVSKIGTAPTTSLIETAASMQVGRTTVDLKDSPSRRTASVWSACYRTLW
jgi:sugar lactone lactonase YvrE